MKQLTVIVERAENNLSAYIEGVPVVTVGDTLDEIKVNMAEAIELYLESAPSPVAKLKGGFELVFHFDVQSLLNHYSRIFSYVALQYLTGINQKQLCHYAMGIKKPREAQRKKIETAFHHLGQELNSIAL